MDSGGASAALLFDHWKILDVDPFFVPTTDEELEEHGEIVGEGTNIARLYIDSVRKRKGLTVNEKLVESGDKQRNLSKNK
jgi:ribosome assembly protein 1